MNKQFKIREKIPEQLLPSDIGTQFSAKVLGIQIVESSIQGKSDLEFILKVTESIKTKYTGMTVKPKIRWAKALTGNGQSDLLLYLMEKNFKTDDLGAILEKEVIFEQHSISELPDFTASEDFTEEYPRHYPVKLIS